MTRHTWRLDHAAQDGRRISRSKIIDCGTSEHLPHDLTRALGRLEDTFIFNLLQNAQHVGGPNLTDGIVADLGIDEIPLAAIAFCSA